MVSVVEDVDETEDENGGHVDWQGDQKHEKVAVVPTPDAIVHPGTMMIEDLKNKEIIKKESLTQGTVFLFP